MAGSFRLKCAPRTRMNPSRSIASAGVRRIRQSVVCFREADRKSTRDMAALQAAALSMPTVANGVKASRAADVAAPDFKYHTSFWHRDLVDEKEQSLLGPGVGAYARALQRWRAAYPTVTQHHQIVVAADSDVFLFPHFSATNAGDFLGAAGTGATSQCAASYRLNFDAEGQVAAMWEFRSGTHEEAHALLREPGRVAGMDWLQDFTAYPCTWEVDDGLRATMRAQVERWVHDVWMQGNVRAIADICAPDVVVYDGVGISLPHDGPVVGATAVQRVLGGIFERYSPGGMVPLAIAVGQPAGNQVALHWTQCLLAKGTDAASRQSGISLFVFDHSGQVVQQLHFSEPLEAARPTLFHETHLVRGCQETRIAPAGPASTS